MIKTILNINDWYDGLDRTNPTLRFAIFIIPMMIFIVMANWPGMSWINYAGFLGIMILAVVRVIPMAIAKD